MLSALCPVALPMLLSVGSIAAGWGLKRIQMQAGAHETLTLGLTRDAGLSTVTYQQTTCHSEVGEGAVRCLSSGA